MFALKRSFNLKRDVLEDFCRNLKAWSGTTTVVMASLFGLAAPAGAWTLGAEATLRNRNEHQVGKVRLVQIGNGEVVVQVRVHGLAPGFHGFHVHAVGKCDRDKEPAQDFLSAAGHFDTGRPATDLPHTHKNHSGDFPVLLVNADGTANAVFSTDRFDLADLFDHDDSAIIVHAAEDNYANIPGRYASTLTGVPVAGPDDMTKRTGDSGDRVACGVIRKLIDR